MSSIFSRSGTGILTRLICTLLVAMLFAPSPLSFSETGDDTFFTPRRLYLRSEFVDSIDRDGRTREELVNFALSYERGLDSYAGREFDQAMEYFLSARKAWPEYFYNDLLIGLALEQLGEYDRAARFYKSYLNKLRKFHEGEYRISSPIILGISSGRIESYDAAYEAVAERLAGYGIDIRRVSPIYTPPFFLIPISIFIFLVGLYIMVTRLLIPFIRKKDRQMHPPEGFWACRKCGAYNPELARECGNCGKIRK
jgi:tetratricopeptide (TPR) repeat protein